MLREVLDLPKRETSQSRTTGYGLHMRWSGIVGPEQAAHSTPTVGGYPVMERGFVELGGCSAEVADRLAAVLEEANEGK